MHSPSSNILPVYNFTGGTEIGKEGDPFWQRFSPGGPILEGAPKFSLHSPAAAFQVSYIVSSSKASFINYNM